MSADLKREADSDSDAAHSSETELGYTVWNVRCAVGGCSHGTSVTKKIYTSEDDAIKAAIHHLEASDYHWLKKEEASAAVRENMQDGSNPCVEEEWTDFQGGIKRWNRLQAKRDKRKKARMHQQPARSGKGSKKGSKSPPSPDHDSMMHVIAGMGERGQQGQAQAAQAAQPAQPLGRQAIQLAVRKPVTQARYSGFSFRIRSAITEQKRHTQAYDYAVSID